MLVFYLFAALLILQAIISLRDGARYLSFVRREMENEPLLFTPHATIIAPCRGLDQSLRENIRALFHQDYPAYEIIFVTDHRDDPALAVIEEVRREMSTMSNVMSHVLIAGEAQTCGQKVHNLRAAVPLVDAASEVLVFVDSDARPRTNWLRSLVAPLVDERTGAATGYRWFIPAKRGWASTLRSVWNASIASALGENGDKNFCWGGSTAIRRETFERARVMEEWEGAVSDDFAMMRALRRAQLPIHFVPNCLTASHEDCDWPELLEFTTRQLKITRVYAPHFWRIVLISNLLFVLIFFGGIALTITRAALGLSFVAALALIMTIYTLGSLKAYLRWRAVSLPLAQYRAQLRRDRLAHLFLWPLASVIYLYNALAALFSRRINWRGTTYELKSPNETVIMERQKDKGKRKKSG